MPRAVTGLSRLSRSLPIAAVFALVLSMASLAGAQSITANGSSGPLAIYAGDQVAIAATGSGHVRDWVGLYVVGTPSGYPYYRRDFSVFPVHHARLIVELEDEDSTMLAALNATRDFRNGVLEYYCWPQPGDQQYNSNSFLHGLLLKLNLSAPMGIGFTGTLFPGWSKPVPAEYYSPPQ
jgi:hypothetical protein